LEESVSTISDVAKAAGVSFKTVSRVINDDAPVGKATRKKVEKAISDLGYVPSSAARTMRSNKSGLVGLITGALSHQIEPNEPTGLPDLYIVQGVQQGLADSGKTLMIADTGNASDRVEGLVRTFLQHRVEALIYVADYHRKIELNLDKISQPVVLVNCFDDASTEAILPDDERCQFDLVTDLVQSGHKRIAYLTLSPELQATGLRIAGYRAALKTAGVTVDEDLIFHARDVDDKDDGLRLMSALRELLALPDRPTVICCGNDEMALRTYGILRSRGLKVPQDISVAGFDNYRAISETLYPPLTTVELPYRRMGQRAAERVLSLISRDDETTGKPEKIAGPVHWRSSVTALNSVARLRQS